MSTEIEKLIRQEAKGKHLSLERYCNESLNMTKFQYYERFSNPHRWHALEIFRLSKELNIPLLDLMQLLEKDCEGLTPPYKNSGARPQRPTSVDKSWPALKGHAAEGQSS